MTQHSVFAKIQSIDNNNKTIDTIPPLSSFGITNQTYSIYKTSNIAGFQNGFFTLQNQDLITPYSYLISGLYEISYLAGLHIPINLTSTNMYIGSDINGENQINAIIDCVKISNINYTDSRVGETNNSYSITNDYNSVIKLNTDIHTLVNIDFSNLPLTNSSDFYVKQLDNRDITITNYNYKINNNFDLSFYLDKPIILDNNGIFNNSSGNIEFWVSPTTDYFNDPVDKYFIDLNNGKERFSIYRSNLGNIEVYIRTIQNINNTDDILETKISTPITWNRATFHKIKFMYDFVSNTVLLYVDGYRYGTISQYINGMSLSDTSIDSSSTITDIQKIQYKNLFNEIYLGSDTSSSNISHVLIDNVKISNKIDPIYKPFGEIIDPQYSSNIKNVIPLSQDAYTTFILSSNLVDYVKKTDFAIVKSENNGNHDFSLTISDTNNVLKNNNNVKSVMEKLIRSLKSASSRVFIKYRD